MVIMYDLLCFSQIKAKWKIGKQQSADICKQNLMESGGQTKYFR